MFHLKKKVKERKQTVKGPFDNTGIDPRLSLPPVSRQQLFLTHTHMSKDKTPDISFPNETKIMSHLNTRNHKAYVKHANMWRPATSSP